MRLFVAVELPPEVRQELADLADLFAGSASVLKWVSPKLLHITVRFLGATDPRRLHDVEAAAAHAAKGVRSFELTTSEPGAFPSARTPRVLWVGLRPDRGYASLQDLFRRLDQSLSARGFEAEAREYAPHITIARVRPEAGADDRKAVGASLAAIRSSGSLARQFVVRRLVVMRSDLHPDGPRYTPLAHAPLLVHDGLTGAPGGHKTL